jgi:hypothetical protein
MDDEVYQTRVCDEDTSRGNFGREILNVLSICSAYEYNASFYSASWSNWFNRNWQLVIYSTYKN